MKLDFLITDIKEFFSNLISKIKDYYENNKKMSLIILGLVCVLFLCIIILICYASISKKSNKGTEIPEQVLQVTEEVQIPQGPVIPKNYNKTRSEKENWTEEDSEIWFTSPGQKEIDSLERANKKQIDEIIEAAP